MSFTNLLHVRNYVALRLQPNSIWDDFQTYDWCLFITDIEGSVGQHLLWPTRRRSVCPNLNFRFVSGSAGHDC